MNPDPHAAAETFRRGVLSILPTKVAKKATIELSPSSFVLLAQSDSAL